MKTLFALFLCCGWLTAAQDMSPCPMHQKHTEKSTQHSSSEHQAGVEKRGDQAMGFSHDKTAHHFRLYADGGAIEVVANESNDSANVKAIRSHLAHIVSMFSKGDFALPIFIHDQIPPGAAVMKQKHSRISYSVEETPAGGSVRIKTADPDAVKAIHEFLRFQIEDHHTGDSEEVSGYNDFTMQKPVTAASRAAFAQRCSETEC